MTKKMSKPDKMMLIAVIIIAVFAVGFFLSKQGFKPLAIFQPEGHSIRQFTQSPDTLHDNAWDWTENYPLSLSFGSTAIIGDYKISTQTTWRGTKYGEYYCRLNTCGGNPIGNDEFGCMRWRGNIGQVSCSGTIVGNCCLSGCDEYINGNTEAHTQYCTSRTQNGGQCGGADACYRDSPANGAGFTYTADCIKQCGGQTRDITYSSERVCWAKADIYYKNQLVKTLDWSDARQSAHIKQNKTTAHLDERLHIDIKTESQYVGADCVMVVNDYLLLFKPNDFILNLTTPKAQAFEDEPISAQIHITNNYGEIVKGKLIINFEVPTIIGSAKKIEEKIIDVPTGKSVHNFVIPTTQITDKIIVTPRIDILMSGTRFSGVNGICYGQELTQYPTKDQSLGGCEFVKIGSTIEETFTLNIIPKPLYLSKNANEQCPSGYVKSLADMTLCIREDVKKLTCSQLGCPNIAGHNYQCTSSGFCAETVFVDKKCLIDANCPSGTKCESSSGLCIKTEIYNNIVQCEIPDDCVTPCPEMAKSCISNKCNYQGECPVRIEKEIVFINITKEKIVIIEKTNTIIVVINPIKEFFNKIFAWIKGLFT